MADCGFGGLSRIASADALPSPGWKFEQCHAFLRVLLQAQRRVGVFGFVGFDEHIKGPDRIISGLCLPVARQGSALQYPEKREYRGFGPWLLAETARAGH